MQSNTMTTIMPPTPTPEAAENIHSNDENDKNSPDRTAAITSDDSRQQQQHQEQAIDGDGDNDDNDKEETEGIEDDNDTTTATSCKESCSPTKIVIGLILVAIITFVIVDSATEQRIQSGIEVFLEWMEDEPVLGFFVFVAACIITTMLFIPGILLTVGAGYVFSNAFGFGVGMVLGILAGFGSAFCGSVLSFLLGRFLLKDAVKGFIKKFALLEALDNVLEEKGLRIMALLRLSPLIYASPYLNYGMGGTSISFRDFTLAMFAILPGTIMFVLLGASASSLSTGDDDEVPEEEEGGATQAILIVGIVVSIIAVLLTSYYAKVELDGIVAANRQHQHEEEEGRDENQETADIEDSAADGDSPASPPFDDSEC